MAVLTYSGLAAGLLMGRHHGGLRNQKIVGIVLHHMATVWSGKALVTYFHNTTRTVSVQLAIGVKGDMWAGLPEEYRSYASDSGWADNRAITIEIANSARGGDWPVSDVTLAKVIDACVDYCIRYGLPGTYTGDTRGTFWKHKWFTGTGCPGPYLESKFPYIAEQVQRRLRSGEKAIPVKYYSGGGGTKITPYYAKVIVTELNVREKASGTSKIVGKLGLFDTIHIMEHSGGWGRAEGKGWVSLAYIQKTVAPDPPAPTPIYDPEKDLSEWIAQNHLMLGSTGKLVESLQAFLVANGYQLVIDGKFGAKTEVALKDWQKKNGLTADGIVGQQTWRAMFR